MSYIVVKMIKGNPYLYQVRGERVGNRIKQVYESCISHKQLEIGEAYVNMILKHHIPLYGSDVKYFLDLYWEKFYQLPEETI